MLWKNLDYQKTILRIHKYMDNNTFSKEDLKVGVKQQKPDVKPNNEDTITLTKEEYTALEKRLKRLEETANKGRLSNYDKAHEDDKTTVIKLRTIDGKVIVSWDNMVSNKAEVDPVTRKVIEDQKVKVNYEDGKSEVLDLITFNRRYQHIHTILKEEIVLRDKQKIEENGDRILTLEDANGKEYVIGVKFVN